MYILHLDDDKNLHISFRGSVGALVEEDWIVNLQSNCLPNGYHQGFFNRCDRFFVDVVKKIEEYLNNDNPPEHIIISGHSQGKIMCYELNH